MDKDPGNSQPEEWTQDLSDPELDDVRARLKEEFGGEDDGSSSSGDQGGDGGVVSAGR